MRVDDRRRQTGYRVLFDKKTQVEAWYVALMLKRLSPHDLRMVRTLAESCIHVRDLEVAAESGDQVAQFALDELDRRCDIPAKPIDEHRGSH